MLNKIRSRNPTAVENEYEIPSDSVSDLRKRKLGLQKCSHLVIEIVTVFAIVLAIVLSSIQLINYKNLQQDILMCKTTVQDSQQMLNQTFTLVQALQVNISNQLSELSKNQLANTVTPTTIPLEICGGPGWRRVAFFNMTDPNQNCPQGLSQTDYSIRSCGRAHTELYNCSSVVLSYNGPHYSRVCGRANAYRWGYTNGFLGFHQEHKIDGAYLEGLSLSYGSPRMHIWSFTSGLFNGTTGDIHPQSRCPCDPGNTSGSPPFVGNDYFCESVATVDNWNANPLRLYPDNALWDGQDLLNPCYGLNNPPWFYKTLPVPTTDDIELRMCFNSGGNVSNIAVTLFELYVL